MKKKKSQGEVKTFTLRLPMDLWRHMKRISIEQETNMAELIRIMVESNKKRYENRLDMK